METSKMVAAVNPIVVTMEPLLLRANDAAKALGVCRRTLFTLTQRGELPAIKQQGGAVSYEVAELRNWIAKKRVTTD
jgi:predicted DNA-binding transcriptional regulator AlpA